MGEGQESPAGKAENEFLLAEMFTELYFQKAEENADICYFYFYELLEEVLTASEKNFSNEKISEKQYRGIRRRSEKIMRQGCPKSVPDCLRRASESIDAGYDPEFFIEMALFFIEKTKEMKLWIDESVFYGKINNLRARWIKEKREPIRRKIVDAVPQSDMLQ